MPDRPLERGGFSGGSWFPGMPDAVKPQWRPFGFGLFATFGCDLCEVEETFWVCCLPILFLVELSRWSNLIDSLASIPHLKSWTACCQVAGNVTWDQANTAQARKFQLPNMGGVTKNGLVSENGTFGKAIRDGLVYHWCSLHFDFQTRTQSFFKVMVSLVGFARQESSNFEISNFPINDFSSIWGDSRTRFYMSLCYTGHRLCVVSWNGLGPCGKEFQCQDIWKDNLAFELPHFSKSCLGSKQIIRSIYVSLSKMMPRHDYFNCFHKSFSGVSKNKTYFINLIHSHSLLTCSMVVGLLQLELRSSLDTEVANHQPSQPLFSNLWYAWSWPKRSF